MNEVVRTQERRTAGGRLRAGLIALLCLVGLALATERRWVCDDAFISYRYADNLIRYGELVFNPGERVEGYTNFLWTLLLAAASALGLDLPVTSQVLGLASFALLLLVVRRLGERVMPALAGAPAWPLCLAAIALTRPMQDFATSGLETMLFTALASAGALLLAPMDAAAPRARQAGFALLALAAMTRPDGLVFYATAALLTLWHTTPRPLSLAAVLSTERARALASEHAFFLCVFAPYWAWRWVYFGSPLPNTFYAKSAYDPYPAQGLYYLGLFFVSHWWFLTLPALFLAGWRRASAVERAPLKFIGALLLAWCAYVAWVGGDFMFARFMIPATPLLYLAFEAGLRLLLRNPPSLASWPERLQRALQAPGRKATLALGILLACVALRQDPFRNAAAPMLRGVVDERRVYSPRRLASLLEQARALAPTFAKTDARIAFWGAQAFLIYGMNPRVAIESAAGLTERGLAARRLAARGRVGHEKQADYAFLLERGAHFSLLPPPPDRNYGFNRLLLTEPGLEAEILRYDAKLMQALKSDPRLDFVEFPQYLDAYLQYPPPPAEAAQDLEFFQRYYFDINDDPQRLKQMRAVAGLAPDDF